MFTLKIETDNDAFQDGNRRAEIARLLTIAAQQVVRRVDDDTDGGTLRDINGNHVGDWVYTR